MPVRTNYQYRGGGTRPGPVYGRCRCGGRIRAQRGSMTLGICQGCRALVALKEAR